MTLRTVAAGLGLLLLAGCGGCGAGSAVSDFGTVVKGAKGATVPVELRSGQRFSLAVTGNASVGDSWSLKALPDPKVASFISEERQGGGDQPGAGSTVYFVFNAKQPGTAEIRLFDCWRCGTGATPQSEESRSQSGEAVFTLTVTKDGPATPRGPAPSAPSS
ncbi:Chagasin family peptidase inhibitor I42 [Nonomuraea coxensis DSM 45129]|uniref:Chagasin family peptidase inhibitor I42 n=1 Tax=Nonomuraea coxensis DSM 45129 TaxID=1122611 RepID=A0ABX8U6S6_9ACTN|nr:protease inhibitor I42 family protein [Nonomuraea coxensis]QYC43353.1 Chagasin family peptidase inhibitor I42 [Nonomuraea coxensis DSM 45129]